MKKIVFLLAASFFCFIAGAQSSQGDINYGVKAGVDLAKFKGENTGNSENRTSFNAGVLMRYHILQNIALHAELFYGGHGGREGSAYEYRFASLFLPVMAAYYFSTFYLATGPQLSYLLSAKQEYNGDESDIKSNYRSANFAWVFGLGYMLSRSIGLDARYSLGIGNIHKDNNFSNVQHSIFMISLVFMLSAKK